MLEKLRNRSISKVGEQVMFKLFINIAAFYITIYEMSRKK